MRTAPPRCPGVTRHRGPWPTSPPHTNPSRVEKPPIYWQPPHRSSWTLGWDGLADFVTTCRAGVVVLAAPSLDIPCLMPPPRDVTYGRDGNAEGGKC